MKKKTRTMISGVLLLVAMSVPSVAKAASGYLTGGTVTNKSGEFYFQYEWADHTGRTVWAEMTKGGIHAYRQAFSHAATNQIGTRSRNDITFRAYGEF